MGHVRLCVCNGFDTPHGWNVFVSNFPILYIYNQSSFASYIHYHLTLTYSSNPANFLLDGCCELPKHTDICSISDFLDWYHCWQETQNVLPRRCGVCKFCVRALSGRVVEIGIVIPFCSPVGRAAVCAAVIAEAVPEVGTCRVVATEGTAIDGAFASSAVVEVLGVEDKTCGVVREVSLIFAGVSETVAEETLCLWHVVSTEPNRPCLFAHMWVDSASRV